LLLAYHAATSNSGLTAGALEVATVEGCSGPCVDDSVTTHALELKESSSRTLAKVRNKERSFFEE
jgi:hypothetical protein